MIAARRLRERRPGASGVPTRALGRRRRIRVLLLALLPCGALVVGGWLWLRSSSLVAVKRVNVTGISGPDAGRVRTVLTNSARSMTTLDVNMGALRMAVAPYPVVRDLSVSTDFPHGLRIRVIEQVPVGAVLADGKTIPVSGDGTLLHDVAPSSSLPMIPVRVLPGGSKLTEPTARNAVSLLAAAPYQLLANVSQVTTVSGHGLVAQLRNGPSIYFGDPTQLQSKWIAASEVLADPGSAGAAYIDVTDPQRPAAGAGQAQAATGTGGGTDGAAPSATEGAASTGGVPGSSSASSAAAGGGASPPNTAAPGISGGAAQGAASIQGG